MPDLVSLGQLPAPEWNRLQELAERFEEACREHGTADLAAFLPPLDDPLRLVALHELIKTDLEMRWRRGRGQELEAYLAQFPELGTPETLPATLLHEGGIKTWDDLAAAPGERLREILDAAGPRYQIHNPGTWPAQSKFAAEGKWDELKEYQDMLIGGKDANA